MAAKTDAMHTGLCTVSATEAIRNKSGRDEKSCKVKRERRCHIYKWGELIKEWKISVFCFVAENENESYLTLKDVLTFEVLLASCDLLGVKMELLNFFGLSNLVLSFLLNSKVFILW
jgi:hypothetical protein